MFTHSFHQGYSVYDSGGTGKPIVFLHGLAATAAYGEFLKVAYPDNRIIIPELPGHGSTLEKGKEIDVYQIALGLRDLFNHYGIEKPIICGHSLGGQIALLYGIIYPEEVTSLLLISPAGLETFLDFQKQLILSGLSITGVFHHLFAPVLKGKEIHQLAHLPSSNAIQSYTSSMMDRPVKDLLNRIICPVTILFGTNDPMIPNQMFNPGSSVSFAEKVVSKYTNFKVIPLVGCGHWPMVENPVLLIKQIQKIGS